jgi:mono/diheme cytochrome c family protein
LLDITRAVFVAARDDRGMRVASQLARPRKPWRSLLALCIFLGAISVVIGGAALAQNLDQGKSAPKLFADGCATCHRSARGLAKGRFSLTLYLFLQDHYASNSSSAWALTSYLESVDSPKPGRSRAAAAKASPPATSPSRSSLRPPASVPVR